MHVVKNPWAGPAIIGTALNVDPALWAGDPITEDGLHAIFEAPAITTRERLLLAIHPDTPPDVLEELAFDDDSAISGLVATRPGCPEHVQAAVALSGKPAFRELDWPTAARLLYPERPYNPTWIKRTPPHLTIAGDR